MMKLRRRRATVVSLFALAASFTLTDAVAQKPQPEQFTAITQNMNVGRQGTVQITIENWSADTDRTALLETFLDKGQDDMLRQLQRMSRKGFLRLPNTTGWEIRYAVQQPQPDGGRRIIIATDRPVSMGEAVNQGQISEYPFTLIELHLNKDGVGEGKMSTAAKIQLSRDKQQIELENYGNTPTNLSEVKQKK
jgi:hypothetical protein